jgi:hypothetical protein
MDAIGWLQAWYQTQCDGEWEHHCGIQIETLDNPGWMVTIELVGTRLEDAAMEPIGQLEDINHQGLEGNQDWMVCKVEGSRFVGAGGPLSLVPICEVFRTWVRSRT